MILSFPRIALAAVLVAGLSGCVSFGGNGQPSSTASPEVPASAAAIDDRCHGMIAPAADTGLWEEELEPLGYAVYGAASTQTLTAAGLAQSEALICSWTDAGAPAVLMIAIGHGTDGFERTEAAFAASGSPYEPVPLLDGAYVACRGDGAVSCHWNVLSGTDWISVLIQDLAVDDVMSDDLETTAPAQLVSALAESVAALDLPKVSAVPEPIDCTVALTPASLVGPLGVEAERIDVLPSPTLEERQLDEQSPQVGQFMWKYVYDLLGYSGCGISIDGNVVGAVVVANNASWILEDPDAVQPALVDIEGHGEGISFCEGDDSSSRCTVAYVSRDDLLLAEFLVPSQLDGAQIALEVLELLG